MIRKGTLDDMPQIESLFDEHFQYQKKYESYTINQRGIFPSTEGLTNAVKNGVLYVREDDGEITAMIVLDNQQPPEFDNIDWLTKVPPSRKTGAAKTAALCYAANVAVRICRLC